VTQRAPARPVIPILPASGDEVEDQAHYVSMYQKQPGDLPRAVKGWFARWRWTLVWLTQLFFYGMPWLQWDGRQALLFDLEAQRFYVFGLVLQPQDLIFLAALLVLSALALFFFTAVAGRLWCGYACPQTVYTEIFLWIERRFEGDRIARMRLDRRPGRREKLLARAASSWPGWPSAVHRLQLRRLLHADPRPGATCCPDRDALEPVLGAVLRLCHLRQRRLPARADLQVHVPLRPLPERADRRGLPGHRLRQRTRRPARLTLTQGRPADQGLGDCIDCTLCVQVCPTGIDIRDGLQNECIGCAACIDACDDVMDKMATRAG
jgi:ferredoxin